MVKGYQQDNVLVVDDNEESGDEYPSNAIPGVSRTAGSLQEQLSQELGVDLATESTTDSVNLRIVKPKTSRSPFIPRIRAIGVIILTLGVIIALIGIKSAMIYSIIVAIPSLIILGYVMSVYNRNPSFEAMIYILLLAMIIITGYGSRTFSGLELYSATMVGKSVV